MASGARARLRAVARRLGVERQALYVRRLFLPQHVRADIRDNELILRLLERVMRRDDDCLDVGAHEGLILREMLRLAPNGRHVAWEPLPAFAARLRDVFPSVTVREAAVSDVEGRTEYAHVVDHPGWSGLRPTPTPGGSRVDTITVTCERIDDLTAIRNLCDSWFDET